MSAIERLRAAIVADVREDMDAIDELTEWHSELVESFNYFIEAQGVKFLGVEKITDADLR